MGKIPDPLGISEHTAALARLGIRHLEQAERQAAKMLRGSSGDREATPAAATDPADGQADPPDNQAPPPAPSGDPTLGNKLHDLLARALEQSTIAGSQALYHRILDDLLPDEARLLGALSEGSASPLVQVRARSRSGLPGKLLLENACLVGRTANVSLPRMTPVYVTHLLSLGVVEIGPEDPALKDDHQILMADSAVRKAVKAGSRGPITPRVEHLTLRMSALGMDLWTAAYGVGE
jgi:hypothetical protein